MSDYNCNSTITVVGLGYVGLPLLVLMAKQGYWVTGYDIDTAKIEHLKEENNVYFDISEKQLLQSNEKLRFTSDPACLKLTDVIIICVPTDIDENGQPDMNPLLSITNTVLQYLHRGQTIIYESSTYPGCTRQLVKILEKSNLHAGRDFFVGFSPERIDPGNRKFSLAAIPKIISGYTSNCTSQIKMLYKTIFTEVYEVSSLETAEFTKLFENTYRFINIAYANEMALAAEALNINIWEVITAAKTKPFGYHAFTPGPGVGGACIPINPKYLQHAFRQYGFQSKMIELAQLINAFMPEHICNMIVNLTDSHNFQHILCLGITYKKDVPDIRLSPALQIIRQLMQHRIELAIIDPYVNEISILGKKIKVHNLNKLIELLEWSDLTVLITDHSIWDHQVIVENSKIICDTRGIFSGLTDSRIWTLGKGGINDQKEKETKTEFEEK